MATGMKAHAGGKNLRGRGAGGGAVRQRETMMDILSLRTNDRNTQMPDTSTFKNF